MSHKAVIWASEQKVKNSSLFAVLIGLGKFHNATTGLCFPTLDNLAAASNMSRSSAKRNLKELARQHPDLIKLSPAKYENGRDTTYDVELLIPGQKRHERKGVNLNPYITKGVNLNPKGDQSEPHEGVNLNPSGGVNLDPNMEDRIEEITIGGQSDPLNISTMTKGGFSIIENDKIEEMLSDVNEESLDAWIRPMMISIRGKTLRIGVPSNFFGSWIRSNFQDQLLARTGAKNVSYVIIRPRDIETEHDDG